VTGSHHPVQEVRDAIYGFVKLSESEWELVDCPEFQRLRDIRQLAMAHLVYPGATHTRLEHSIGCVHLSALMFDALVERDGELIESEFNLPRAEQQRARQVLRLAALLHDIGHPPFSHSAEELLASEVDQATGKLQLDSRGKPKRITHEEMTARIIREGSIAQRIETLFEEQRISAEEVIAIATDFPCARFDRQPFHVFLHDLLAGELGSDRIDYLLRDAHHSGQKAGDFDYRRLVGTLRMVPPPEQAETGPRIGFDHGGWLVAEQMIVARYLMYQSLYFHKTKRIFEIHLEQFMREWLKARFDVPELPVDVSEFTALTDSAVLAELGRAATDARDPGRAHAQRFRDRSHMRLARELILADNCERRQDRRKPDKKRFAALANGVRIKFGESVVIDEPDRSATTMFDETTRIWIRIDEKTRYLDDISEIVRGMSDKIWRGRIYADREKVTEVKRFSEEWLKNHPAGEFKQEGGGDAGG